MHNFAEILRQAARGGWDRLLSLTFHQFRDVVDGLTPGTYLGLFLKDDSRILPSNPLHSRQGVTRTWPRTMALPAHQMAT